MKDKKLLVLGGIAQLVDIIKKAQANGVYVIVVDYLENSPAKLVANKSYLISTESVNEIVNICRKEKVDGVINYCIDPAQKPYQEICSKLSLPCYGTKEQFDIMTNKDLFYNECLKYGVGVVKRIEYDKLIELQGDRGHFFPLVVKPVDGRASKGITVCKSRDELSEAIEHALNFSSRKKFIIEKFMDGRPEVCAKYFVIDGSIYLTSFSDTFSAFVDGKRAYIIGKRFPSKYYSMFMHRVDHKIRNMIKGMNIKNGPLSFTGFIGDNDIHFFDPSFRLGGGQQWHIENELVGVDSSDMLTFFALNGYMPANHEFEQIPSRLEKKFGAMLYFLVDLGKIKRITGIEDIIKLDSVVGHHLMHKEGDEIKQKGTSDHVLARFFLVNNSVDKIKRDIDKAQKLIEVYDENLKNMLISNLDSNLMH